MLVSIKPADVRMMANDNCSTRATSSAPTRYPPAYTTTSAPRDEARVAPANVAIATPRRVPANTMAVDTLVVDTSRCARNVARYGGLRAQREAAHHGALPEDRPRCHSPHDDDRGSGVFYEALHLRAEPAADAEGHAADARALRRQRALTRRRGAGRAGTRAQETANLSQAVYRNALAVFPKPLLFSGSPEQ